jgi:4'-phosphopantetheinyl transferase
MSAVRWLLGTSREVPEGTAWLGPWEAARAARLTFAHRRGDFLLGRWTAKRALAAWLGCDPGPHLEVRADESGAPRPWRREQPLEVAISLTHRGGFAACALAEPGPVGIDLELVEPRSDAFVASYFTDDEQRTIGEDRALLPNVLWSAKESVLKLLGDGLRRDVRDVEIALGDPATSWASFRVRADADVQGFWWTSGGVIATVAAPAPAAPPVELITSSRPYTR